MQLYTHSTHSCRVEAIALVPKRKLYVQAQHQALFAAPAQFPILPQPEASEQPPPGVEPEPSSAPAPELVKQVVPLAQPVAEAEELHAPEINAQRVAAAIGITGKIRCLLWISQSAVTALQKVRHRLALVSC